MRQRSGGYAQELKRRAQLRQRYDDCRQLCCFLEEFAAAPELPSTATAQWMAFSIGVEFRGRLEESKPKEAAYSSLWGAPCSRTGTRSSSNTARYLVQPFAVALQRKRKNQPQCSYDFLEWHSTYGGKL